MVSTHLGPPTPFNLSRMRRTVLKSIPAFRTSFFPVHSPIRRLYSFQRGTFTVPRPASQMGTGGGHRPCFASALPPITAGLQKTVNPGLSIWKACTAPLHNLAGVPAKIRAQPR